MKRKVRVLFRRKDLFMLTVDRKKEIEGRIDTITPARKKEIEGFVDAIIQENGLTRPGFDLIAFLTQKEHFKVGMQNLDKDTTGLLLVNEHDSISNTETHRLIVINSSLEGEPDFYKRRRFIAAHEYAHFKLDNEGSQVFAHRDYHSKEALSEKEADYFARCLLMPRQLVENVISVWGLENASIDEKASAISDVFKVTKKKARQRLVEDFA